MKDHTASIKVDRSEYAEIQYALYRLNEYYKEREHFNLADKALKMWEEMGKGFDKLYSDV